MSKFKIFFLKLSLIFSLITIFIFISARSYSKNMFKNISNNFLRLHVVANSDSTEDQILKYKIRDAVIDYMKPYFSNINTKKDALEILNSQKNNIETNVQSKNSIDKQANTHKASTPSSSENNPTSSSDNVAQPTPSDS